MKGVVPNLCSDLVPGTAAAGFYLGESFSDISGKIGAVEWFGPEVTVREILLNNTSWIGTKSRLGFGNEFLVSYRYMDEVVSLYFEKSEKLYRVAVGNGYHGSFNGVSVGDDLHGVKDFDILFNDVEDEHLLVKNNEIMTGVSLVTDYRASLEDVPEQVIKFISIHDWSLR